MTNETLKNPSAIVLPNAVGIDAAIKTIQLRLAELTWIEKCFGRAWTRQRTVNDQKRIEPMTYQGSTEYYPCLPNDALKSYCFFRAKNGRTMEEYEPTVAYGNYYFKDPVDIIFWFDLKAIDKTKNYVFTEELIQSVLSKLNQDSNVMISKVWDDRVDDIFSGYNLFPEHRDLLLYPYGAFRIEMILQYNFTC